MNDAENLTKLLGHVPPALFHAFANEAFAAALPPLMHEEGKREQRAAMAAALAALTVPQRQRMEEVAERIVLLADGAGQDVVEGIQHEISPEEAREAFRRLRNQFERSLWLYRNAPLLFDEALNARQADVFRQKPTCYSGYLAPKSLVVLQDPTSQLAFHTAVAEHLGCSMDAVAVQIFMRLRPDTETGEDVDLYQVSVHHNRPPEAIERVENSELVPQEVIRAVSSHITYEPSNGHLEVLSMHSQGREALARIAADTLLESPFYGERIPLKHYDYQCLAVPREFDISGEIVSGVKVVELGYTLANHRALLVKIGTRDADNIYLAAKSLISPTFDFQNHPLTYAKIAIRIRKVGKDRARTVTVILRDDNRCNIKTKRERDRALCDRLLARWGIVQEVGGDSVDALAA